RPRRPIPTIYLIGTEDPLAPLDGGEVASPFGGRTWMPSVPETWRVWAKALGCPPEPAVVRDHDGVHVLRHGPCAGGAEFLICTMGGLGHHGRGGKGMLSPSLAGSPSDRVRANDVIWNFFRGHPLPPAGGH